MPSAKKDKNEPPDRNLSNVVKILFNAGRTILSVALSKLDPNVPPGLEYLVQLDQLVVKQQVELLEGNILFYALFWGNFLHQNFCFFTANLKNDFGKNDVKKLV